jgi:hypothetical protein
LQKIDHFRRGLVDIERRPDEKRIERNVITALRLDMHANRIYDLAAGCGHKVHVVEFFAQHHICRLECGEGRKVQIREPWRQEKTDAYDVGLPWVALSRSETI